MCYLPSPSHSCLPSSFPPAIALDTPALFPLQLLHLPNSQHRGHQNSVKTTTPRVPCFYLQSRAGWECYPLQQAFPLAKEGRVGGGFLAVQAPATRVLPSCPLLCHGPLCSGRIRWAGGGEKGQLARRLGSGRARGQS